MRASQISLAQLMQPEHANLLGNVHGGYIMKLVDECGALACMRHAQRRVVTIVVDSMTFREPIKIGYLVNLIAEVTYTGRTSMEAEVLVEAENPVTGVKTHTNHAYVVYVALDDAYLRAVDPNGQIKWAIRLGDVRTITLTVGRNGLIYAPCDDGVVHVIDQSGAEVHRLETGGWPTVPIIAAENTLIFADSQDYSVFINSSKNAVWATSSNR